MNHSGDQCASSVSLPEPGSRLERVIGVGGVASCAVNCIVGSGIFGLPGIVAAMLGPAAFLAYLVCVVLIGLVGLCFAEVGSRVANGGGLYAYATEAFGPIVGGVAGTLLWTANSVVLGQRLSGESAPLVALASAIFGPWGSWLLLATTVMSIAGYMSADILGSPRVFAALAERNQLPRVFATVHPRFKTPAVAICLYALMCAAIAWTGSFRQLVIVTTSGTLVLYLICCLGLLRLRAKNVATGGPPFRAPGGALVPIAAAAIILWLLSTLSWAELSAAMSLVAVSGATYALQERRRRQRVGSTSRQPSHTVIAGLE